MGFLESSNLAFYFGVRGLAFGFATYFLIKLVCGALDLSGAWRLGLTIAAVLMYPLPQVYDLAFPPDFVTLLSDPALSPDGLWLAIKSKFYAAIASQLVALAVDKHFFPS